MNLRAMETGQIKKVTCPRCGASPIILVEDNTIGVCPQCRFEMPKRWWKIRKKLLKNGVIIDSFWRL